jgi:1,4-dihydroxy-2-naphthoate polyprenyltransferase
MTQNIHSLSTFQRWMLAIRPRTLPAAAAGGLLGAGIAWKTAGRVPPLVPALVILACALLLQILANLVNDVADFQKGTDTAERLGPVRVTQSGLLSPRQMWAGVAVNILLAGLGGLYLAWVAGWVVIAIGAASILIAMLYTVGPFALEDLGLGDLFALLFFGLVAVGGTVYILTGRLTGLGWLGGLAAGCLTTAILVVNNVRDIETDRQAGRKNIPVVWGRRAAELEYGLMLGIAYVVPVAAHLLGWVSIWALIPLVTLPRAMYLYRQIHSLPPGRQFNLLLADTAQLLLLFSVLFGIGINF